MSKSSGSEWRSDGENEKEQESDHSSSDTGLDDDKETARDGGYQGKQEDDGEDAPSAQELEERRQANIKALLSGSLALSRKPLLPRLLSVQDAEAILKRPFQSPHPHAGSGPSEALRRKLLARRQFVPWGSGTFTPLKLSIPKPSPTPELQAACEKVELPPGVEPLVLWEPPPGDTTGSSSTVKPGSSSSSGGAVVVDDMLTAWLRPHQREGVQFMFECVCGLRKFEGQGCILADDMGLGKTLQGITLLWTLLNAGHGLLGGTPIARRVIICCPTSLVSNWDSECVKFLKGRVRTLPLCESSRDDVISSISQFLSPRNYFQALGSLACKRRVLLSGTPLQNHLDEFYAMVSFCNPGVLGTPSQFRKHFELPILAGREPGASEEQVCLGAERSAELSAIVNDFILRRTNSLLSAHLPPKVIEVVCCRMTPLQTELYCHFLQSKAARSLFSSQKASRVLSAITSLRKLLNHPKLIYDALHSNAHSDKEEGGAQGFEDCGRFFPPGMFDAGRAGRGGMMVGWEALSGKFAVLARMLESLRESTRERIVVVSNYTQTLDLVAQLCREKGYPALRLDGSTTITKRQKLVKRFNDPADPQFVFLLSSKAGGCGLNLIGGSRLVLFDPDWNPANDKQAAGRIWRDGQKRRVFVYRFLTSGTIEEKVYQRQLSKEGLQQVVNSKGGATSGPNLMSMEELRDLFSYDPTTLSSTYESLCKDDRTDQERAAGQQQQQQAPEMDGQGDDSAAGGVGRNLICKAQVGKPAEEDLQSWGHHSSVDSVPDPVMQQIGGEHVSFVFSCQVDGKALEPETSQERQSAVAGTPGAAPPSKRGPSRGSTACGAQAQGSGPSRLQAAPGRQTAPGAVPAMPSTAEPGGCRGTRPEVQQAAVGAAGGQGDQFGSSRPREPPAGQAPAGFEAGRAGNSGGSMWQLGGASRLGGDSLPGRAAGSLVVAAAAPAAAARAELVGGLSEAGGSHGGKENTAANDGGAPATCAAGSTCPEQPGRPPGRSLLSLPKRPATAKPPAAAAVQAQPATSSGQQQKRKLVQSGSAASKKVICISDSDDDFQ
ncbi:hypothetical protein N2152v2_001221 [Parachlorella kessleri]